MKLSKNKMFALFLLWFFFHLILFLTSGNFLTNYDSNFYPFPLYETTSVDTYQYSIYKKLNEWFRDPPSFEKFVKDCKASKNWVNHIWTRANETGYGYYTGDSTSFYKKMMQSINKFETDKTYTKYSFFTTRLYHYDYSEFIIYLLIPIVIYNFKKLWLSNKERNCV